MHIKLHMFYHLFKMLPKIYGGGVWQEGAAPSRGKLNSTNNVEHEELPVLFGRTMTRT